MMRSKRTVGRAALSLRALPVKALSAVAVAGAVLTPATASSAPVQSGYDGHLEEANAWAVDQLNVRPAWDTTRGAGVTVAVVDTGIGEHPFFEDKDVLDGYSTLPDEEHAWHDRAGDPSNPDDKHGHGTAVASMVLQAAPEATILPVRDGTGAPDELNAGGAGESTLEAVRWAVDNGADVVVMAWGVCCTEEDEDFHMAMQYAVDHDAVLLAAAGNDPESRIGWHFPAGLPGVVAVTGTAADGSAWESSTTGPEADVAAPADFSLVRPVPQGQRDDDSSLGGDVTAGSLYEETGGTSLAVGWAGGVVALVRAAHPDLDADDAIQRLIQTAQDRGTEGRDDAFGFGVPDAAAAVSADVEPVEQNPLGYPLGVAGASGETATGEPAPGTGAAADGAAGPDEGGGSQLVPLVVVVLATVVLAGGAGILLQRRAAPPGAGRGGQTAVAPVPIMSTGVLVVVLVALIASAATYVGADTLIGKTESAGSGGEIAAGQAADGESDGDGAPAPAGSPGALAADGNEPAMAAQAWQDAHTAGDLEAFRSRTCENPWYRVAINLNRLQDPSYVRPGFSILWEDGGDWQADDYRLLRQSGTKAWVEAGDLSIGGNPTYEIALVWEAGAWKVCDFWMTGPWWQGSPEWNARFPRGDESGPIDT